MFDQALANMPNYLTMKFARYNIIKNLLQLYCYASADCEYNAVYQYTFTTLFRTFLSKLRKYFYTRVSDTFHDTMLLLYYR